MPLILISGYPTSGKTHRSHQLAEYFHSKIANASDPRHTRLSVCHISDQTLGLTRDAYRDAKTEKNARAAEYSAIKRAVGKDTIVIADGLNYIKGFRYQLYCEAKAVGTGSCVIHIGTPIPKCRELNSLLLSDATVDGGYEEDIFENLVVRYEEPNGMTRWDSPLFTVLFEDERPPNEAIWEAMVGSDGKGKVVRPNLATVLAPPTDSDYLYDIDRITQEIINSILEWQKSHPGEGGGEVFIDGLSVQLPVAPVGVPVLQRMRRQFFTLNRKLPLGKSRVKESFVGYLNDGFQ